MSPNAPHAGIGDIDDARRSSSAARGRGRARTRSGSRARAACRCATSRPPTPAIPRWPRGSRRTSRAGRPTGGPSRRGAGARGRRSPAARASACCSTASARGSRPRCTRPVRSNDPDRLDERRRRRCWPRSTAPSTRRRAPGAAIVVAEQAGEGLLPPDRASRAWLDLLGEATQRFAARADAGRPRRRRPRLTLARRRAPAAPRRAAARGHRATLAGLRRHGDRDVRPGDADHAVNVVAGGPPPWLRAALEPRSTPTSRATPTSAPRRAALAELHGRDAGRDRPDQRRRRGALAPAAGAAPAARRLRAPRLHRGRGRAARPRRPGRRASCATRSRLRARPDRGPGRRRPRHRRQPGLPSGTLDPAHALLALRRPGRVVVVDEAFMDLVPGEPGSLVRERLDDVIVVRSITKALAIPGLRAGYAVAPPPLADAPARRPPAVVGERARARRPRSAGPPRGSARGDRRARRAPSATTSPAASQAVDGPAHLAERRELLPGRGRTTGRRLVAALRERGIAVRPAASFPGLDAGHIRLTARDPHANALLVEAIERRSRAVQRAPRSHGRDDRMRTGAADRRRRHRRRRLGRPRRRRPRGDPTAADESSARSASSTSLPGDRRRDAQAVALADGAARSTSSRRARPAPSACSPAATRCSTASAPRSRAARRRPARRPPAPVGVRARLRPPRLAAGGRRARQRGRAPRRDRRRGRSQPGRRLVVFATGEDGAAASSRVAPRRAASAPAASSCSSSSAGRDERSSTATAQPAARAGRPAARRSRSSAAPAPARRCWRARPACPTTPTTTTASSPSAMSARSRSPRCGPRPGSSSGTSAPAAARSASNGCAPSRPRARSRSRRATTARAQSSANALRARRPRRSTSSAARAPARWTASPPPDAIFIGGGLTRPAFDACWRALPAGGRLVANAVTLEGEQALLAARAEHGGELTRIEIAHAEPLGSVHRLARADAGVQWSRDQAMTVHFIGAGPGAPDLLTLRAQRLIAAARSASTPARSSRPRSSPTRPPDARLVDTQHLDLDEIVAELERRARRRPRRRAAALRRPVDLQRGRRADAPPRRARASRRTSPPASRPSPRPRPRCGAS